MIALILAHPHIFWLSLGGLLLAAEMLGGNGYLLWSGIAGVVTGLLVWMLPLSRVPGAARREKRLLPPDD